MKYIVTLFNRYNPMEKRREAVEADSEYLAEKQALSGGLREGWGVWRTDAINPLRIHVFFGVAPCRCICQGDVKGAFDKCEDRDGDLFVREFETEKEKDAYILGLKEAQAWEGFSVVEDCFTDEEVPEKVKELDALIEKQ